MKSYSRLIALAIIFVTLGVTARAQVSATATATATIVTPIAITKTVDMNFGNVAVHPSNPGTVVLATDDSRTATGGVTLPATAGTVSAASFTVEGEAGYTYSITLPASALTITRSGGTETMAVDTWVSNPSLTGTLTGGSQQLDVGATLNVGGGQQAGTYVNASGFTVTVNYN